MEECSNCSYYEYSLKEIDFDRDCYVTRRDWCKYFKRRVSPTGHCDKYYKKDTLENSGYTSGSSGSSGCFLTSACVKYLGKSDDCEELTALRKFRDTYMKQSENGRKLVEEYYEVAPKIVENIDTSDKKDTYYQYINEVISRCVKLLALGENERVLNEYQFMVTNLKKEFVL
jgi:hypothetical protein